MQPNWKIHLVEVSDSELHDDGNFWLDAADVKPQKKGVTEDSAIDVIVDMSCGDDSKGINK